MIVPGKELSRRPHVVVALRRLRNANGRLILGAPGWFAKLRDNPRAAGQRALAARPYARIFAALKRAGIARPSLYEAWDFTVASRGPDLPAAVDPQQRVRPARGQATSPTAGWRAGRRVLGDEQRAAARRSEAPRRPGHIPGAVLPRHVRRTATTGSTTARASQTRCRRRSPGTWQRRSSSASSRRPLRRRTRRGSRCTGTGCSVDASRSPTAGFRISRPGSTWRSARRTGGARRPRHRARGRGGFEPEPVPGGRRPAPAGSAQHPVPRPADAEPAGLCHRTRRSARAGAR